MAVIVLFPKQDGDGEKTVVSKKSWGLQVHDPLFEVVARADGRVSNLYPIVVDGRNRIAEESGYLDTVGCAQAHQSIDAQFGGERVGFWGDASLGYQQFVEFFDEVGVEFQERLVKLCIEHFAFIGDEIL